MYYIIYRFLPILYGIMYADRSPNSGYFKNGATDGWQQERGFWGVGKLYFEMSVDFVKIYQTLYTWDLCTSVYVCYTTISVYNKIYAHNMHL